MPVCARELARRVDRIGAAACRDEDLRVLERRESRDACRKLLGARVRERPERVVRGELPHLMSRGVGELGAPVADVAEPERAVASTYPPGVVPHEARRRRGDRKRAAHGPRSCSRTDARTPCPRDDATGREPAGAVAAASASIRSTSRPRTSARNPRSATPTNAAPPAKATWKPWTSASDSRRRSRSVVLLAASEARIARPSAPPICCDVLKSRTRGPVLVVEAGRRDQRQRHEDEAQAERRHHERRHHVDGVAAVGRDPRQQAIPTIVTTIPKIATGLTPTRGANFEASPAEP